VARIPRGFVWRQCVMAAALSFASDALGRRECDGRPAPGFACARGEGRQAARSFGVLDTHTEGTWGHFG
jgi:hypothetical protein